MGQLLATSILNLYPQALQQTLHPKRQDAAETPHPKLETLNPRLVVVVLVIVIVIARILPEAWMSGASTKGLYGTADGESLWFRV